MMIRRPRRQSNSVHQFRRVVPPSGQAPPRPAHRNCRSPTLRQWTAGRSPARPNIIGAIADRRRGGCDRPLGACLTNQRLLRIPPLRQPRGARVISMEPSLGIVATRSCGRLLLSSRASRCTKSSSVLMQYDSTSCSLGSSARFRWEYAPGSDILIVYSDGRQHGA